MTPEATESEPAPTAPSEEQVGQHCLISLSHADAIWEIFGEFFEDWMDERDKLDFVDAMCAEIGITLQQMNDQIETGISNGYSVGKQIEICKIVLQKLQG